MIQTRKLRPRIAPLLGDAVTIRTRCAFCDARIDFHQHPKKKIKERYYCNNMCQKDYRILKTPTHPRHWEVRARYKRLTGR